MEGEFFLMFLVLLLASLLGPVGGVEAPAPLGDAVDGATQALPDAELTTDLPLCPDCGLVTDDEGASVQGPAGVTLATAPEAPAAQGAGTSQTTPAVSTPMAAGAGFGLLAVLAGLAYKLRWLSGVFLLTPLFSRIKDDEVLDHPLRQRIADFIEANPGAAMNTVRDALETAHGTTVYHLGLLEKRKILISEQDGIRRRYWLRDDPAARDRRPAILLSRPAYREIARFVAAHPGVNQSALCKALGMRPPAASKKLRRLQEAGLVDGRQESRRRHYWAAEGLGRLLGQPKVAEATA